MTRSEDLATLGLSSTDDNAADRLTSGSKEGKFDF